MDSNWNAAQGGAGTGPSSGVGVGADSNANVDWRLQLQPDARQRIVNKIMDTLKRHLPVPVPEGLNELQKIAVRFEEKIYSAATSQPDYLRKISLKMLSMETKAQPGINPSLPIQNRIDSAAGMTSQQPGSNPSQSLGMPQVISQAPVSRQQQQQSLLQGSQSVPTALAGGGATIPPMSGPSISNNNHMSGPGGASGPGGPTGSLSTDMYSNAQRRQQPQQLTSQNQMLYQQQQIQMRQKQQQQQQSLLQQTQMQMSSALAGGSGMMPSAATSGMQQSQLNSVQQQPTGQGGSFQQQTLMRQQQQQPQASMQNSTIPMQQTNNVTDLQQQRLQMQQNQMQQSQLQQSQLQQNQLQQNQMQQSQMQQNQMQQNQMQQNQMQQNQMQQNQMQQSQMQQNQMQQSQMKQNQMQQSQMQQNQMQQSQMQQSQIQQNQMQQSQMQQNQMQQNQMPQSQMQQNQMPQNQMQQNQLLNQQMLLGQQQNQILGNGGASNINNMQRQMQIQRQALLQQQQPQQQQHLLSQLQSQQQQLPQQQQTNMMQQREMQMPQQRIQGSSALLQTQNTVDSQRQQQQQFIPQQQQPQQPQQQQQQQQRVLQDVASSPASMDSTAQTGHPGDWQEEMYQKVKSLKDTYYADLREIHQKLSIKLNQLDNMVPPNIRGGEQIEKMKHFKLVLERMMTVLSFGKHNLQIGLKEKLPLYEKQIISILQNNKKVPQQQPQSGASSDQTQLSTLQQSQAGMQSQQPPQQQQPQGPQQMDIHTNQLQQQLNTSALTQLNSLSMPNAMQQGMQNTLQSDQFLANSTGFGSLQQGSMGPTMQNSMNAPQMVGSGAAIGTSNMSHAVSMPGMQTNMSSAQVLKQQQQHQEQQIQPQQRMMPTQQQIQQRQLQQQRLMQKQQLLQQQLPLSQQKQQHPQQNQIQQIGQPSDLADLKSRQGAAGLKPGSVYQQQYPGLGPRNSYYLKPGSNLPISSPQNIQSSSPQISQPSPQVDQGLIPSSQLKSGTPLQVASSPFVPSPSPPVAPSPMIEDTKLGGLMHNSAAGQIGQPLPANSAQAGQMGQPQPGSLAVGTPGISASPLLAEFTSPEAGQGIIPSTQVPETEKPIEKLARLMRTMPRNQRSAAVKDIASVVSMVDRIAGSAPGNGSRAAIGDDLVAMTKCRLQAKNLVHPDGTAGTSSGSSPPTKKMKRDTSAMPLNINNNDESSPYAVSATDNFKITGPDGSEMQFTSTSSTKGLKSEMHRALLEELREINIRLIDTELTLNEEDSDSTAEAGESILVKCTYKAITLSPSLRAHFTSSHLSTILPLRLLVPAGYPKCSPIVMDKLLDEQRDIDDFSSRARSKFNISIRGLSQPMSLKEIAHTWENCVRKVINEYAAQFGGGSFSSRMIKWQTVNPEDPYIIV